MASLSSTLSTKPKPFSLVKNLSPYLFKSKKQPPTSQPNPEENLPPLIKTSGQLDSQTQHGLSPAERHFVFTMIPKAFLNSHYDEHCEKLQKAGTLVNIATYHRLSFIPLEFIALSSGQSPYSSIATENKEKEKELNTRLEMMQRILGLSSASESMLKKWNVQRTIELFRRSPTDTGSSEVQVAILTLKIDHLKDHLTSHRKDHFSKRQLDILEGKRKRLLKYLKRQDLQRYCEVLNALELQDIDS